MTTPTSRVTAELTISLDGYSAGLNQTEERPFGDDGGDGWGDKLHSRMGATTINQYLAAGLIDELRLHIVPLILGAGTRLFDGVPPLNVEQIESRAGRAVTHVTYQMLH